MSEDGMGIRTILSRLKNRLISRDLQDIFICPELTAGPLEGERDGSGNSCENYRVFDGPEVLEIIDRINPLGAAERAFARDRLGAGDKAIIRFHDNHPVFYGWVMFDEIEVTYDVFKPMPQGNAFAYNLHTLGTFRRRGAMTGFYRFLGSYLAQQGVHTLYVGISLDNQVSIKAHLKNGFENRGYFYTLRFLGLRFTLARFEHAKRFFVS